MSTIQKIELVLKRFHSWGRKKLTLLVTTMSENVENCFYLAKAIFCYSPWTLTVSWNRGVEQKLNVGQIIDWTNNSPRHTMLTIALVIAHSTWCCNSTSKQRYFDLSFLDSVLSRDTVLGRLKGSIFRQITQSWGEAFQTTYFTNLLRYIPVS